MFVNGVMFNSETWQGLGSTDITILEIVDHKLMDVFAMVTQRLQLNFII